MSMFGPPLSDAEFKRGRRIMAAFILIFIALAVFGFVSLLIYVDKHTWFCISKHTCTANAPGWPNNIHGPGIGWR